MPEDETTPYAGRWIARVRGEIVGQGGTPQQALQAARFARFKESPEVVYIPMTYPLPFSALLAQIRPALPGNASVYLVGGAVRDALLGQPTHDLDFAVQGNALHVARGVANHLGAAYYTMDEAHGTGRVVWAPEEGRRLFLDFATLRGPDLEADLRARDFTINAIAMETGPSPTLLDPLGGALDLRAKRLRACSPSSLHDDPVRILRAVRQAAAFGLQIDLQTRAWMREAVPLLPAVSPERQSEELMRILGGPQPATCLRALDILGVVPALLPELPPLKGVTQSPPHVYDTWHHTLQTVQHLETLIAFLGSPPSAPEQAGNLMVGLAVLRLGRFREQIHAHLQTEVIPGREARALLFLAALLHDTGKPTTRTEEAGTGRIHFLGHEEIGEKLASARAHALHMSNPEVSRLRTVVRHHMRPHHLAQTPAPPTPRAIYRFFRDTREAGVDICLLNLADVVATYGPTLPQDTWTRYLDLHRALLEAWWERHEEQVRPPALVNGFDLIQKLGLKPGPRLGALLERVREAQAAGEVRSQEEALELVRRELREG